MNDFCLSRNRREFIKSLKCDVQELVDSSKVDSRSKKQLDKRRITEVWKEVGNDLNSVFPEK